MIKPTSGKPFFFVFNNKSREYYWSYVLCTIAHFSKPLCFHLWAVHYSLNSESLKLSSISFLFLQLLSTFQTLGFPLRHLMAVRAILFFLWASLFVNGSLSLTLSSKLVHRFSEEAMAVWESRSGDNASLKPWPKRNSLNYFQLLLQSDLKRQKLKLGSKYEHLFPSEGSQTLFFGNELDWWVDFTPVWFLRKQRKIKKWRKQNKIVFFLKIN